MIGYGFGGVRGVLAGGALAQNFGYVPMYAAATGLALLGTLCAWRVLRLEDGDGAAAPAA